MPKFLQLLLLLAAFACLPYARVAAQPACSIQVSDQRGCIPFPVQFTLSTTGGSSNIKSVNWFFGDNAQSTQLTPTHVYQAAGKYFPRVVITFQDGKICQAQTTGPVVVNDSPNVNFFVPQGQVITLCDKSQPVCFKDLSKPGQDKAPISSWIWTFGNGTQAFTQNPCVYYTDSGTYRVALEVGDTNGCRNLIEKVIRVRFASESTGPLKPEFRLKLGYDCKQAVVHLTNVTDTTGANITKFVWDFGDGTIDSCRLKDTACLKKWKEMWHGYPTQGTFHPTLTIYNAYGCSATYRYDSGAYIEPYKLVVQVNGNEGCFAMDSTVSFMSSTHPYASYYMWDFGDPYNPSTGRFANIEHTYRRPGEYTVRYKVKVGDCIYDTTLCLIVKLKGPMAHIMQKPHTWAPWDSVPKGGTFLISPSQYASYFDTACQAAGFVKYYRYRQETIPNGDTLYSSCLYDTIGYKEDTIYNCKDQPFKDTRPILRARIMKVKDKVQTVGDVNYWFKGDVYPTGPVYSRPPFKDDPLRMNDTALFPLNCSGPTTVKFTNFSIKGRKYRAIDDYPLEYPDTCRHKAYPFASDSLQYEWDFREGDGSAAPSTKKNPNIRSRISYETLPTHRFIQQGCYWVRLTVRDSLTGCEDYDSIPVVTQSPDAGWGPEYSSIKHMTWNMQQKLPVNKPRRGMILQGLPCVGETQMLDLSEVQPSCFQRNVSMVYDSVAQTKFCDGQPYTPFYDNDKVVNVLKKTYEYNDSGFKTVGIVIRNNAYCADTQWYHNYKYIHGVNAELQFSKKQLCIGDTLRYGLKYPQQQGVKLVTMDYFLEGEKGDILMPIKSDTFRFITRKNGNKTDTISSTMHSAQAGIDDGTLLYSSLFDTFTQKIDLAGHLTIRTRIFSRFGCVDSFFNFASFGHYADIISPRKNICLDDTASFSADVRYYIPFRPGNDGFDYTPYWLDPDSVRHGRTPAIREELRWDLDGDGSIDFTGSFPRFRYPKPGLYTVVLYSRDSTGCEQITERKDFINVIDIRAGFGVDTPGAIRVCAPHFFRFLDSSVVTDFSHRVKIASWTWDFGDSTKPITLTDSTKRNPTFLYAKNGTYNIKLTVTTSEDVGTAGKGCSATFSRTIKILGPRAEFEPVGPMSGCVPFVLTLVDKSKDARVYEWKLGNGTSQTSHGEDTVRLLYTTPGTFCPALYVGDTIVDLLGRKNYCIDTFPSPACRYKVTVYAPDVQKLTASDTVLCVKTETLALLSKPDTGYASWTIDYGNGITQTNDSPKFSYIYPQTGRFLVRISGTGARCPRTDSLWVNVVDVKAEYQLEPMADDTPWIAFVNTSVNGVRYRWDFGEGTDPYFTESKTPFRHEFKKPGMHRVCLTAINAADCPDKFCQDVNIITDLFIPNVFTPNGDDWNNRFRILIRGHTLYHLEIYNRWGEKVFFSDDRWNTWDGTNSSTGAEYPEGIFYFVFTYRHIGDESDKKVVGTVSLVR